MVKVTIPFNPIYLIQDASAAEANALNNNCSELNWNCKFLMCLFHVMSNVKDYIEGKKPSNKQHIVTNVELRKLIEYIKQLHGCLTQADFQIKVYTFSTI